VLARQNFEIAKDKREIKPEAIANVTT